MFHKQILTIFLDWHCGRQKGLTTAPIIVIIILITDFLIYSFGQNIK
jgi:uncharacterized membrane protein